MITGPELDKLQQLGDRAWLYIATSCKSVLSQVEGGQRPRLRIIQNPISKLSPEVLYRQIQYLVEEEDWTSHGEDVSSP
ncbi:MAG: hypothetical protein ACE5JO_08030 [Candidatus Binatia bacterium]